MELEIDVDWGSKNHPQDVQPPVPVAKCQAVKLAPQYRDRCSTFGANHPVFQVQVNAEFDHDPWRNGCLHTPMHLSLDGHTHV